MKRLRLLKSLLIKSNGRVTLVEVVKTFMNSVSQVRMALPTKSVPFFFTQNVGKLDSMLDDSEMRLLSLL